MPQWTAGLAIAIGLAAVGATREARAVDLNGLWSFTITDLSPTPPPFSGSCIVTITQTGMTFSLSSVPGSCSLLVLLVTASGTIDPGTGAFNGSASIPTYCNSLSFGGIATDSFFSSSYTCADDPSRFGQLSASRCGNGIVDPGEDCDDFGNPCCSPTCQFKPAASACTSDGNTCTIDECDGAGSCVHPADTGASCTSDGNPCTDDVCDGTGACSHPNNTAPCDDGHDCTGPDICADGACMGANLPDGTACDDGNACSSSDACNTGICTGNAVQCAPCLSCDAVGGCIPAPATGCKQSADNSVLLKHTTRDNVIWRWRHGDPTSAADLGDPSMVTEYAFCIYNDASSPSPGLLLGAAAPAGNHWSVTSSAATYRDPTLMPDGLKVVRATSGGANETKVIVRGKGMNLSLPPLSSITLPLRVQLQAGDVGGTRCWEASYATPTRNDAQRFKAKN